MNKMLMIVLLMALPLVQGCPVILGAAAVSYAIDELPKMNRKVHDKDDKKYQYNCYVKYANEINSEQEKINMPKENILSFEEWKQKQSLTP
jgi:hypothetical protein